MLAQVPVPPVDTTSIAPSAQTAFTVVTSVPMVVMLALAIAHIARGKGPLLLYCFVGGAFAAFFEPVADILSQLYFPRIGQHVAFETFGRPIPWFLVFAYPWFVGGQGYLAYRIFRRGITRRGVWLMWLCFFASNIAVETPGLLLNAYTYYGEQPFNPWGFPLWNGAVQSIMPMATGALILAARPHLRGDGRLALVIALPPIADGMTNAGLALPVWSTLNSDLSLAANYVGGTATIGLAATAVWLIGAVVARPARHMATSSETVRAAPGLPDPEPVSSPA